MTILTHELWFPDSQRTNEDGLLAIGGDLKPDRLLLAYRSGIFPWFMEDGIIYWFCPPARMVLFPEELHISHSMKRTLHSKKFRVTKNQAFEKVIRSCAAVHSQQKSDTWISDEFIEAYTALHHSGHAHSVEVWQQDQLAGGIYGVVIGNIFYGESMFSTVPNASKVALIEVCTGGSYALIDCQVATDHMATMGARTISRNEFLKLITETSKTSR